MTDTSTALVIGQTVWVDGIGYEVNREPGATTPHFAPNGMVEPQVTDPDNERWYAVGYAAGKRDAEANAEVATGDVRPEYRALLLDFVTWQAENERGPVEHYAPGPASDEFDPDLYVDEYLDEYAERQHDAEATNG